MNLNLEEKTESVFQVRKIKHGQIQFVRAIVVAAVDDYNIRPTMNWSRGKYACVFYSLDFILPNISPTL